MTMFKNVWVSTVAIALISSVPALAQGWQAGSCTATDVVTTATTTSCGIGITCPAVKLHVEGGTSNNSSIRASSTADVNHSFQLAYNGVNSNRGWNLHQLSSAGFSGVNGHGFLIEHYNGTSFSQPFVLTEGGKCGINIGTTVITNTLELKGNAAIGSGYVGTAAPTNGLIVEGNVGIGYLANPGAYRLYVNGNTWTSGSFTASDMRWKQNVTPIDNALSKVLALKGVTYDFRRSEFPNMNFSAERQMGFIAQELEKVAPEVVTTNTDGFKGVSYANLTALLAEAIKEQNHTIVELKARLETLEALANQNTKQNVGDGGAKLGSVK